MGIKRYVMEDLRENDRLDRQAQLKQYSLATELKGVILRGNESVLDAGCGTGLLGRYLREVYPHIRYTGADLSVARIEEARQINPVDFNFQSLDLYKSVDFEPLKNKIDMIFNRYVMHHLRDHKTVLENFFAALQPGGRLCVVDIDGIFCNVGTNDSELAADIKLVSEKFGGDLHAARKLPALMGAIGFRNIRWKIQTMDFQHQDRQDEVDQFRERLEFGKETYIKIFGGELPFRRFMKRYLDELASPTTAVFYNKFIIQAEK